MAKEFSGLTIYRMRDHIDSTPITKPDDFIDDSKKPKAYALTAHVDFEARLFVAKPDIRPPAWAGYLEQGFGKLTGLPDSVSNSAVLLVNVKHRTKDCYFAVTFGFGRFLLRPGSYERNYGLRVALNAVYPRRHQKQELDPNRIRSVDSKIIAANVLRTRRQADRRATFETFDMDIQRDLLTGLTGQPFDEKLWGGRLTGSDALSLNRPTSFDKLGALCRQIEAHSSKIPSQFSWVDKIYAVRDSALIKRLKNHIAEMIKNKETQNLELAPPELVEWGDIRNFAFSFDPTTFFAEPEIAIYIAALEKSDKLSSLTVDGLTSTHRLNAYDQSGAVIHHWPVFKCLSGEFKASTQTHLLSEGDFFDVSDDYVRELNRDLSCLKEFKGQFPASKSGEEEGTYNKRLAESSKKKYLLLDRATVHLRSGTTEIEICDVLSSRRELVHVKRKLNSSSLSHLFSQGLVSADLLLMSTEFRKVARDRIGGVKKNDGLASRLARFFPDKGITASEFTVLYGIIAKWKNRTLAEALPFFSRVNLRRCSRDLMRMGYNVSFKRIPVA